MNEIIYFGRELSFTFWGSLQTMLPILFFFLLFQALYLKLPRQRIQQVLKGLAISLVGLTLFLFGVEYGLLPAGEQMGIILGGMTYPHRCVMIPLGLFLGFASTLAEPAVRVLGYEVDKATSGLIKENLVIYSLAVGVAIAVSLGMARIIFGFPIQYLLIPGYLLILVLLKFTSSNFMSIAFDAGGVATGPMITTFVVAVTLGTAEVIPGRDPVMDGFGLIALVAMFPILLMMLLGLMFER